MNESEGSASVRGENKTTPPPPSRRPCAEEKGSHSVAWKCFSFREDGGNQKNVASREGIDFIAAPHRETRQIYATTSNVDTEDVLTKLQRQSVANICFGINKI